MSLPRRRILARSLIFSGLSALLVVIALVSASDRWVKNTSRIFLFDHPADCPQAEVALVLGCAPEVAGGRPNFFFTTRMQAAAELHRAGKCRFLLVSGDNGHPDYDEPSRMKEALLALGVPAPAIVCDYAGFDTLDSVLRARDVFGQSRFLVVSQAFHNERAVSIARYHGIDAYGFNARDLDGPYALRIALREKAARVKTLFDLHLLGSRPKYLGPAVTIGSTP